MLVRSQDALCCHLLRPQIKNYGGDQGNILAWTILCGLLSNLPKMVGTSPQVPIRSGGSEDNNVVRIIVNLWVKCFFGPFLRS
jgi:hypothetical protein